MHRRQIQFVSQDFCKILSHLLLLHNAAVVLNRQDHRVPAETSITCKFGFYNMKIFPLTTEQCPAEKPADKASATKTASVVSSFSFTVLIYC